MANKISKAQIIKYIELTFYGWLFLLPWQTRYFLYSAKINDGFWEAGSFFIYTSEIFLVFLLIVRFVLWIKEQPKINFDLFKGQWFNSLPLALIFLVGFAWFSILWSADPMLTLYYAGKMVIAAGVFWLVRNSYISWHKVGTVLIAAGLLQSLLAVNQFLNQIVMDSKWLGMALQDAKEVGVSVVDDGYRRWLRAYGSLPHPNILGGFLSVVLVFLLGNFWQVSKKENNNKKYKAYHLSLLLVFIFIGAGLALSFSRAAWLATALIWIVTFVFLLIKEKKNLFILWLTPFIIFVFGFALWSVMYPEPFKARIMGEQRLETLSNQERVNSLNFGKDITKEYFPLGTGVGAYTHALHKLKPKHPVWFLQQPHNFYLLVFAELGVIGLMLLIWVFYTAFRTANTWQGYLLLVIILFLMLFDHWWWSLNFGWYFMAVVLGLISKESNGIIIKQKNMSFFEKLFNKPKSEEEDAKLEENVDEVITSTEPAKEISNQENFSENEHKEQSM